MDALFFLLAAGLAGLSLALIWLCDSLMGEKP